MKTNKPKVVAWKWRKSVVNDHGETAGGTCKLGEAPGVPLVRLSDYKALQAKYERLLKHLQNLIDQTTPLEPEPGNPMWSRRIQLDEVMAERDQLRAECEKLRKDVAGLLICDECHDKCADPYTGLFASHCPDEEPCIMCECSSLRRKLAEQQQPALAAAAPELLDALMELADWYREHTGLPPTAANAAIAKATGGSP